MKTWIIVLIFIIFLIFIFVIGILIWYFFFGPGVKKSSFSTSTSPGPIPNNILKYGDIIRIYNNNSTVGFRGYMVPCGTITTNSKNKCLNYVVVRYNDSLKKDNESSLEQWKITSSTKAEGSPVLYNDDILIKTLNNNTLELCGTIEEASCSDRTGISKSSDVTTTNIWNILPINVNSTGTVSKNTDLYIINKSTNKKLSVCRGLEGCGLNVSLRTDNPPNITRIWQIQNI